MILVLIEFEKLFLNLENHKHNESDLFWKLELNLKSQRKKITFITQVLSRQQGPVAKNYRYTKFAYQLCKTQNSQHLQILSK